MLATLLPPAPLPSPELPPERPAPTAPPVTSPSPPQPPAGLGWLWRLAGVLVVALAAAAVLVLTLFPRSPPVATAGSGRVATATAVRDRAAAWVADNVGHNVLVGCDALACADLAEHGFPASGLSELQSTAPDVYGSQVIVATASVRSQFGRQLADVFAPEILASFGSGANRIDIRVIAPEGPAAFRTAMRADLRARKSAAAQLLGRSTVMAAPTARGALAAGEVDSRLLTVLAFLASQEPIDIMQFGAVRGASEGVPLRVADLSATDPARGANSASYQQLLLSLLRHSEISSYAPMRVASVKLPSGQDAVQITYAAPSPLGLLG